MTRLTTTVFLSDGAPCDVGRLGLYELDRIPKPSGRPYTYTVTLKAGEYEVIAPIEEWLKDPPEKPKVPEEEIEEGTGAYYALLKWARFQAALTYYRQQQAEAAAHFEAVEQYILEHCVAAEDRGRIVTHADREAVCSAALVPPLTMELLKETLQVSYSATWKHQPLLDALEESAGGGDAVVNAVRAWEGRAIVEMKMTEAQWAQLDLRERARRVCDVMMPKWQEHLALEKWQAENAAQ